MEKLKKAWYFDHLLVLAFFVVLLASCFRAYLDIKVEGRRKAEIVALQGQVEQLQVQLATKVGPKLDQVCPAWFFETNLRETKREICGGRK